MEALAVPAPDVPVPARWDARLAAHEQVADRPPVGVLVAIWADTYETGPTSIEHDTRISPRATMPGMPMDPIPPEALLDHYPGPMRDLGERLRGIVRDTFPDVLERVRPGWHLIGYDLPIGRRSVYFAYVAPEYEHVHLGFEHGWAMRDPDGLLQGRGSPSRSAGSPSDRATSSMARAARSSCARPRRSR